MNKPISPRAEQFCDGIEDILKTASAMVTRLEVKSSQL